MWLRCRLFQEDVFEIWVRDYVVGYEESVDGAEEEERYGGTDGVEFWDGKEEDDGLKGGADEECGLQGEVGVDCLGRMLGFVVLGGVVCKRWENLH